MSVKIEIDSEEMATLFWLVFGGRPVANSPVENILLRLESKFEKYDDILRSPQMI
jgi:hypothetical protein